MSNSNSDKTASIIAEVIETHDLNRLYQLEIECNQDMAILHHRKNIAQTTMEQSEVVGDIKVMQSIINAIQNKIPDLKDALSQEKNTNVSLNHKFRLAAKNMLKKDTYDKIMDQCFGRAKEIRANKVELRNNRLE